MTTSNSNSDLLAALLLSSGVGTTFTGLITTKKGKQVGGKNGKVYGNDQIHTTVVSGFSYERLVQRSLKALPGIEAEDVRAKLAKKGHTVTDADVEEARAELIASFEATLAGESESSTSHVYEPLVVTNDDGTVVPVKGSRVYKCCKGESDATGTPYVCHCRNCTGDPRAPLPGTIYLQGLAIWTRIIKACDNGPAPEPNSSNKTLAKNALRKMLPVGRYVSHPLEKGTDFILAAGGTAQIKAQADGYVVTDDVLAAIAKVA